MENSELRIKQTDREEFVERLREAVGGSVAAVADMTGIKVTTLHGWLKDTKPPFEGIVAISKATNVSLDWLANGQGPKDHESVDTAGSFKVKHLDVSAANGTGLINEREDEVGEVSFDGKWLRHIGMTAPSAARVITASGPSNEPHIRHGDMLLVDTGVQRVGNQGFYALLESDGGLRVKYCQRKIDGAITVRSANQNWPDDPQTLSPDQEHLLDVRGLVRWYGRAIG